MDDSTAAGSVRMGISAADLIKNASRVLMAGDLALEGRPLGCHARKGSFSSEASCESEESFLSEPPALLPATPSPRSPVIVSSAPADISVPEIEEGLGGNAAALYAINEFWDAIHHGRSAVGHGVVVDSPRQRLASDPLLLDYDRYIRMHYAVQRALLPPWSFHMSSERAKKDWEHDAARCFAVAGGRGVTKERFRESIAQIACMRVKALAGDACVNLDDLVSRAAAFLRMLVDFVTIRDATTGLRRLRISVEVPPDSWQHLATVQPAPTSLSGAVAAPPRPPAGPPPPATPERSPADALREDVERRVRIQARHRAARSQASRAAQLVGTITGAADAPDPALLALSNRVQRLRFH